jgi:hypothetical protein
VTVPSGGKRPRPGGLWLLLAPAACCAGPLLATGLATGLATAGALVWSGLGLALATLTVGALMVIRRRRAGAAGRVRRERR